MSLKNTGLAIGEGATAAIQAKAFGHHAQALAPGAIALGHGAVAREPGEVVVTVTDWSGFLIEMLEFWRATVTGVDLDGMPIPQDKRGLAPASAPEEVM